jgi:hypothetical protein
MYIIDINIGINMELMLQNVILNLSIIEFLFCIY